MAFYLKLPRGTVPYHRLVELAINRMTFLFKLISSKENVEVFLNFLEERAEYSECLIEGNANDKISHFILRLACLESSKRRDLFVEAETMLFKLRLQQMSPKEKNQMLRIVKRHLEDLDVLDLDEANHHSPKAKDILAVLCSVVQQLRTNNLFHLGKEHWKNSGIVINVPFQYVLPLVATRNVNLERGIAFVAPHKTDELLQILFSQLLTAKMEQGSSNYLGMSQDDERLQDICDQLGVFFGKNELNILPLLPVNSLTSSEINECSRHFPPCMRFLHARLRKNHRLRHSARVEYSLFLKEIGLPASEAVKFWENEYSKPPCGPGQSSKSCRQWKKDRARYIYSIRHLYGLEGSKRCYAARSCSTLQNMVLGPLEDGGCPFKHFDSKTLKSCLQKWGVEESECNDLASIATKGHYTLACSEYLKTQEDSYVKLIQGVLDTGITSCCGCFSSCKRSFASGNLQSKSDMCPSAPKYRCVSCLDPTGRKQIKKDDEDGEIYQFPTSDNNSANGSTLADDGIKLVKTFSKPSEFFIILKPP